MNHNDTTARRYCETALDRLCSRAWRAGTVVATGLAISMIVSNNIGAQPAGKISISFYGGPENLSHTAAEASLVRNGFNQRTPYDCFILCGGNNPTPFSFETGTETFMLTVSYARRNLGVAVNIGDGVGGESRGYRNGTWDIIHFDGELTASITPTITAGKFTFGAGPAIASVASHGASQKHVGLVLDGAFDVFHLGWVVTTLRAQERIFPAFTVTSSLDHSYKQPYTTTWIGVGIGYKEPDTPTVKK